MNPRLVWVPEPHLVYLGGLPDGFEASGIPDDPAQDPRLRDVEFVVVRRQDNLRPLYERMTALKVVQTIGAGVNAFVEEFPSHLTLCSAKGAHDVDVAEYVVAAVLAGQRQLAHLRDEQVAGRWSRNLALRLQVSTVLFIGYGSIAQAVETRLTPFGTRFLRIARRARPGVESVSALRGHLGEADVVIVLAALTRETRGLLDAEMLSAMKTNALLVNAARGEIVDTASLVAELTSGRIRAVLDTTDPEPLPVGHALYSAPGVLVTPHVGGGTKFALQDVYDLVTDQIHRYATDEPLANVVADGY